jgi:hypothetical protein
VATGSNTARNIRIAVLLAVLVGVIGWGYRQRQFLGYRRNWLAPLPVAVVLVAKKPVPRATVAAWRSGLERLEGWGEEEIARYRGATHMPPIAFRLTEPVVSEPPPLPGAEVGVTDRAAAALAFERAAKEIDAKAGVTSADQIVILVLLGEGTGAPVEGLAEREGKRGVVQSNASETELGLELVATFHEVLHCVGATDKYDENGHAVGVTALAEPDLAPLYPQRFGEVMVGEVALAEGSGRPIRDLTEAMVGPETAREVGWVK